MTIRYLQVVCSQSLPRHIPDDDLLELRDNTDGHDDWEYPLGMAGTSSVGLGFAFALFLETFTNWLV